MLITISKFVNVSKNKPGGSVVWTGNYPRAHRAWHAFRRLLYFQFLILQINVFKHHDAIELMHAARSWKHYLGTDGVWEFIESQEAVDMVAAYGPEKAQEAAERLAQISNYQFVNYFQIVFSVMQPKQWFHFKSN